MQGCAMVIVVTKVYYDISYNTDTDTDADADIYIYIIITDICIYRYIPIYVCVYNIFHISF